MACQKEKNSKISFLFSPGSKRIGLKEFPKSVSEEKTIRRNSLTPLPQFSAVGFPTNIYGLF